jgi:methylisocitrate lyase
MLFPEALLSAEEFGAFAREMTQSGVHVPLMANMTEFGKTPYLRVSEFQALGYRAVLFPVSALRVAARAVETLLAELACIGTQREWLDRMMPRQALYDLLRYDDRDASTGRTHERGYAGTSGG